MEERMQSDAEIIRKIINRYGHIIDLKKSPQTIIDIIRIFAEDDGGLPPGGVPPAPPPPGPTSFQAGITNEEILKAVLKLARDVGKIKAKFKIK
jgi:hypothetical protein